MSEGIITIKKGREKPILNQHPWIFSGAVMRAENAIDGDLVTVVDHKNNFLGRGYWNSRSQIQVRILTWQDEDIDDAWWESRLRRAIQSRTIPQDANQIARRLVNAENDFLPGLIIDKYGDWYVLQALTLYIDLNKNKIADLLGHITGTNQIYERSDVDVRQHEGLTDSVGLLKGDSVPHHVEIIEGNTRYNIDMVTGHKTGFYLDQRTNRQQLTQLVQEYADTNQSIRILNLFSYTGGFALASHQAGISTIHTINVDASYEALELAETNYNNNFDATHNGSTEFIQADGFDYLHHCVDEGELFDIIILDPPKFAHNKRQVDRASRGYKDLNLNAFKLIKSRGYLMTYSCSGAISQDLFQKIVFGALADSGKQAQIVQHLSAGDDHPIALTFPEGEYLKGLLLRVF